LALDRGQRLRHGPAGCAGSHSVAGIRITPGDPCVANHNCLAGYHQTITYQPPNRYWPFQWAETALFAGVAVILIGFCFWWINGHRLPGARRRTAAPTRPDAASHTRKSPVPTR
jgi:hypothetical protein